GGAHAIAKAISNKVKSPKGAQGSTTLFGIIVFFDDYFNALTVGSVMRPVTDRMKVSREKLAYIVDSTSAPMSLLAPVSTWVVFVMGLIGSQFVELNITGSEYLTYITTIPFNFYSILALLLVGIIIWTQWDFGLMVKAEYRARKTGKLYRDGAESSSDDKADEVKSVEEHQIKKRNMNNPIVGLLAFIPPMFLRNGDFHVHDIVTAVQKADGGVYTLTAAFIAGIFG